MLKPKTMYIILPIINYIPCLVGNLTDNVMLLIVVLL